jgi:hypothetical protein
MSALADSSSVFAHSEGLRGVGSRQCQTGFCVLSAMGKERAPALLVAASANGRYGASTWATAKNVTAVANGVAIYVAAVVKSNRLLQSLRTSISRAVSVWKRNAAKGGREAAQRSRASMRRSRAFDWRQFLMSPLLAQSSSRVHRTCPLLGVKRTSLFAAQMSAFDPKQASLAAPHMSAF